MVLLPLVFVAFYFSSLGNGQPQDSQQVASQNAPALDEKSLSPLEKELKAFLDDTEPILRSWVEEFKNGQLELGLPLNARLKEWRLRLARYQSVTNPKLTGRMTYTSRMIDALYDESEGKPTKAMRGKGKTNPLLQKPDQTTRTAPKQKPANKQKAASNTPPADQEKDLIVLPTDKKQRRELRNLWDQFLAKAENRKLWEKLKNIKSFKFQRLEFGPTQGKLVYLESTKNGEVVIKINPKITYYSGLEEKTLEELLQTEMLTVDKLNQK